MSIGDINNAFQALMEQEHSLEQNTPNQQVSHKDQEEEEIDIEELERQLFGAGQYRRVLNWADDEEDNDDDEDQHPAFTQQKQHSNDSFDACNSDFLNGSNDSETNKNPSGHGISPRSQISQTLPAPQKSFDAVNEKNVFSGLQISNSRQLSVGSGFGENVVQQDEDEEGWTQVKSKSSKNKKKNGNGQQSKVSNQSQNDKRRSSNGKYSNGSRQNSYSQRSYK
eukprot:TRINITY_DN5569_c3_g2_i2.p1 TRINITY_DN5569_c3_g2~~TRINITY_DN5569_c3_g2_i2.p1  ORF type:complete len:224 (+),score=37.03 TRINITY_DN5569_c3_g2_i2:118-789(+)